MIPDTEKERLYDRWYELTVLYHEAVRLKADPAEAEATKVMAAEAWDDYVICVTEGMRG
jgi:hypothetical protein